MKEITLKNGELVELREITRNDVNERHHFFVTLSFAQTGIVHTIDEIDVHTEETRDHVDDFLKNRRGWWLLAWHNNHVIGEVDITVPTLARIRHNGALTIGILPSWQGLSLGRALMYEALTWAQHAGLLRISLSVFSSNIRAQRLYEQCGFVVEGVRRNYLRTGDDGYEDDILMARYFEKSA